MRSSLVLLRGLALLAAAGLALGGCKQKSILVTGAACATDDDCDPGDDCVGGFCQGSSAGPDGGVTDAGGALDAGPRDGGDAGPHDGGLSDAGDAGAPVDAGTIGLDGGTVDLLDFTFTGDTRSANCDDASGGPGDYPAATFESELSQMTALYPQFGFDLGDHMYVCSGSLANAQADMKRYTDALAAAWSPARPFFMTMGNHECEEDDCSGKQATDANYVAYQAALTALTGQTLPYYSFQVQTRLGRASFIFVADHYFDDTAKSWLKSALKDADANSAYTFVIKHYPVTGSRQGPSSITSLIQSHHFSLVLTSHEHQYAHDTTTSGWGGRSVICGLGGANASTVDQGFCRVQQQADGSLLFTQYDLTGNPGDTWSVTARQ